MDIKEKTITILKRYEIGSTYSYLQVLPKAAVLIPLFQRDGELQVLMTLRSLKVSMSYSVSGCVYLCTPFLSQDNESR